MFTLNFKITRGWRLVVIFTKDKEIGDFAKTETFCPIVHLTKVFLRPARTFLKRVPLWNILKALAFLPTEDRRTVNFTSLLFSCLSLSICLSVCLSLLLSSRASPYILFIQCPPQLLAPLVNMSKTGYEKICLCCLSFTQNIHKNLTFSLK